jgi:hypothetical protein
MNADNYKVIQRDTEAVSDLLKAVVNINWLLNEAAKQGWGVTFTVEEDDGRLGVKVERYDSWPTVESEAEGAK